MKPLAILVTVGVLAFLPSPTLAGAFSETDEKIDFAIDREIVATSVIIYSREMLDRLDNITNHIRNAARVENRIQYKIILSDIEINAYSAPGGHIYVTTGLLRFVEDDSELAGVL